MNEAWAGLLGAVIVAILTLVGNLVANWYRRRNTRAEAGKTEAEETDILTASAIRMVQTWETQVNKLEKRVAELETALKERDVKIAQLDTEVAGLRLQVRDLSAKNAQQAIKLARLEANSQYVE
jgi:septal ring factor EnvC (AmiA/AmiB activator)